MSRIVQKFELQNNSPISDYALVTRRLNKDNGLTTWVSAKTEIIGVADGLDEIQTDIVILMAVYNNPKIVSCSAIYAPVASDPPVELIMRIEKLHRSASWLMTITHVNLLTGERTVYPPVTNIFIDLLNTALTKTFIAQLSVDGDYTLTSVLLDATFVTP